MPPPGSSHQPAGPTSGVTAWKSRTRPAASVSTTRTDGQTASELEDYVDCRWWEVGDILGSSERFYPGRLPELLPAFLAGENIDEPFEFWN